MKRLNEEEFETMKWALNFKQLEEIQAQGPLVLNKQQAIDPLIESIKLTNENRTQWKEVLEKGVEEEKVKEMLKTCLKNSEIRNSEETELLNKLENDTSEYEIWFMKGNRG